MEILNIPFCITRWADIEPVKHMGESGFALWHTQHFGSMRVRMVEYSPRLCGRSLVQGTSI